MFFPSADKSCPDTAISYALGSTVRSFRATSAGVPSNSFSRAVASRIVRDEYQVIVKSGCRAETGEPAPARPPDAELLGVAEPPPAGPIPTPPVVLPPIRGAGPPPPP